ncbi:hypothetical protein FOCC_FOCC004094 [Frankliniella occidentalis]|nr:hypothetical protein FOCC_FOCC004094 [Frankliniella occidentalis]
MVKARLKGLYMVDLRHMDEKTGSNVVDVGVDLSEFYMSVEWDILEVPAVRNEKFYTCCDEPYLDITFNITMRRKTLFYTVNIIIPCMGISFLTVLTFYLPSDSGEKVTLSISILISLHVFFLLVVEIIPPTSLVVPLLGKYLIFAMILVSISICVTVVVLNVHFRSPQTHKMAPWVKRVFIHILPRLLVMRRPQYQFEANRWFTPATVMLRSLQDDDSCYGPFQAAPCPDEMQRMHGAQAHQAHQGTKRATMRETLSDREDTTGCCSAVRTCGGGTRPSSPPGGRGAAPGQILVPLPPQGHRFSHAHCPPQVKEDWKYVAMVLDRLFLWIFTLAVLVGTAGIILQAPSLYDDRMPIDKRFADVVRNATPVRCPPPN